MAYEKGNRPDSPMKRREWAHRMRSVIQRKVRQVHELQNFNC